MITNGGGVEMIYIIALGIYLIVIILIILFFKAATRKDKDSHISIEMKNTKKYVSITELVKDCKEKDREFYKSVLMEKENLSEKYLQKDLEGKINTIQTMKKINNK